MKKKYLVILSIIIANIIPQNVSFANDSLNSNETKYIIDKWETLNTKMPTPRSSFTTAVHNNNIYIMGGDNEDYSTTNKVEVYDTVNNTWSTKANMLDSRLNHASAVIGDKVYVTGGISGGKITNTVQVYDIANNRWEMLSPMNTARDFHSLITFNDKLYAIGGRVSYADSGVFTNSIEEYDPEKNIWVNKAPMPVETSDVGVTIVDDKIYCIKKNSQNTSGVYIYDPAEDKWEAGSDLNVPFYSSNIYNINDVFYIMSNNTGYMYDPKSGAIEKRQESPRDSITAYSAVVNNKIYVFEGEDSECMMEGVVMAYTPVAASEKVIETVSNPSVENLNSSREEVNKMPEGEEKDNLQKILNDIMFDLGTGANKENLTGNVDVYIKSDNMLSISLDTNSVTFDGYSGTEPMEKLGAVNITIDSSLPYDLNAYMPTEIQNADGTNRINMNVFKIKEGSEEDYQTFEDTANKIVLKTGCMDGNNINHAIDLKLDSSEAYTNDVYKTVIKFEAEQK